MRFRVSPLILLVVACGALAQTTGPSSLPAQPPIPRAQLEQIYARELGNLYKPADAQRVHSAHELLEAFFAHPESRRAVIAQLQTSGLDANLLGRLVRIRMNWPALEPGVYYINERVGPHPVRYFLGIPKGYDRAKSWPLVIKLPTADAFVTEPRPDPIQVNEIYASWMSQELSQHPDAVLIMPLLNLDDLWGPSYAGMNNVIQPMQHVTGRVNIDPLRVYLVGHGMSAHAVWNLALHMPTYFASFNSFAGSASADWQRVRLTSLRNVWPIFWHDEADRIIRIELARQLVKAMRAQKVEFDYTETRNIGHVPPPALVEDMYRKMRQRSREPYPAAITLQSTRLDTAFNRSDWLQIYQPTNPGKEQKYFLARGTGKMSVYQIAWTADASVKDNTFNITAKNVDTLRVYVNDQLIDFDRAVSVVVNKKARYEAILSPSIEEMLKDQLFVGRGWRYFTGVIDIDLAPAPASRPSTTPQINTDENR